MSNVETRAVLSLSPRALPGGYGTLEAPPLAPADPALRDAIEHDLVPRLMLAHRAGPLSPAQRARLERATEDVCADDQHAFLDCVLGTDEDSAGTLVRGLLERGVTVEAVYLDLLAPTAVTLGHLWEHDECDFLEVTVGLGRLQRVLRELGASGSGAAPAPEPGAHRVLLSCLPGEQHTLGLYMVAEFFLRDGWGVQVGSPTTDDELAAMVRDGWYDAVGFSVACDARLLNVRHQIASVRRQAQNTRMLVLVGGRVFSEHPELVAKVGADGYAAAASEAPSRARTLLARVSG